MIPLLVVVPSRKVAMSESGLRPGLCLRGQDRAINARQKQSEAQIA